MTPCIHIRFRIRMVRRQHAECLVPKRHQHAFVSQIIIVRRQALDVHVYTVNQSQNHQVSENQDLNVAFEIILYFFMSEETCETKLCGPNELRAPCRNACNTYSCSNKDGSTCKMSREEESPTCVRKSNYHRASPNGPCIRLYCPEPTKPTLSPTITPCPCPTKPPSK